MRNYKVQILTKVFLTWYLRANCHYQSCQGPLIDFKKLRITRIMWEIDGCALVMCHIWVILFCTSVPLLVKEIYLSNFIDKDTKSRQQITWTGLWDSGHSFLDTNTLVTPLHRTEPWNRKEIWICFVKFQSNREILSCLQCIHIWIFNVFCHHFLPFSCLIWITDQVSRGSI